jgi:hypothetical protein
MPLPFQNLTPTSKSLPLIVESTRPVSSSTAAGNYSFIDYHVK